MPKKFGFQVLHITLSNESVGVHQCKRSFLIVTLLLLVLACALQKHKAHQTLTSLALQNLTSELSSTFRININCYSKFTTLVPPYPMPPAFLVSYRISHSWYFSEEQTKSQTDALLPHSPVWAVPSPGCKTQSGWSLFSTLCNELILTMFNSL